MGLDAGQLQTGIDFAASREPGIAAALASVGYPEPRPRPTGYRTLLRTIVGQQVSVAAASSIWNRLETYLGAELAPADILAADFEALRGCGLSRQKQSYARSLCELVANGEVDIDHLPADDEAAIAELTQIKGIGRWSAEVYLLFAEGRADIWPAGDLAVQAGLHKILRLDARPDEKTARIMGDAWRPHRGAVAIFTWHCYDNPAL